MLENQLVNIFSSHDFQDTQTAVVAVSGGSDSLALLFLLQLYNKLYLNKRLHIVAANVDHQLRPESAAEALWVKKLCQYHAITHHLLRWTGTKADTGISTQARLARYKLLYDCAKNYEKPILLTGHTLNDQIETFLMRQQRNSWRGLSAMARKSLIFKKIYLLRPLLSLTKEELRNYLTSLKQTWIEDPTNYNTKYERARTRQIIGPITPEKKTIWVKKLQQQQLARVSLNQKIIELIMIIQPYFIGEVLHFTQLPPPYNSKECSFLLNLLTSIMGGAAYLAQTHQMEKFAEAFTISKPVLRYNICQAMVEKKSNLWRIWRESRQIPILECKSGENILWDKRYEIYNTSGDNIIIRAATLDEMKNFSHPNKINLSYHQSSLIIEKAGKTHLPFLTLPLATTAQRQICLPPEFEKIKIQPYIAIYDWLISGFDHELYRKLKAIFNFSHCAL